MPRDLYEQTATLDDLVSALQLVSPGVQLDVRQPKYFRWRARFLATPHLQIWRAQSNADWICKADGNPARFYVSLPTVGALETVMGKRTYASGDDHALIATSAEPLIVSGSGRPENAQINIKWEPSAFREVLSRIYEQDADRAHPGPCFHLRSDQGQLFQFLARSLAAGHFHEMSASPTASALISETMLRLLIEGSGLHAEPLFGRSPASGSSKQVRAAIELMYERLHEPLTLSVLAADLGVSGRALQQGFRKHHDTTPLTYLRNLRLQAVHRELSSPRNTLSVSEVAAKWGFAHVGRLARLYRATYGRTPSATVQLAQRRR